MHWTLKQSVYFLGLNCLPYQGPTGISPLQNAHGEALCSCKMAFVERTVLIASTVRMLHNSYSANARLVTSFMRWV